MPTSGTLFLFHLPHSFDAFWTLNHPLNGCVKSPINKKAGQTLTQIFSSSETISQDLINQEIATEVDIHNFDIFDHLFIKVLGRLSTNYELSKDLYDSSWVALNYLIQFDNEGVPTLSIIVRTALDKPQYIRPSKHREKHLSKDLEFAPIHVGTK